MKIKSYDSWYEGSHDKKVDSWINSLHPHTQLLESLKNSLVVVEDSLEGLTGTLSKGLEEFSKLHINFNLNLHY